MDLEAAVRAVRLAGDIPALAAVRVSAAGVEEVVVDGVRRNDGSDPVQPTDRFHLGSNAKALTALISALAVERGALTWDTTAAQVLGDGAPTLRQLLTHGAGLHPYGEDEQIARIEVGDGTPMEQRAAFARATLAEAPLFQLGTRHEYSNAGVVAAAAMTEAATGEPWEEALEARIFRPLGVDARIGWPIMHAADAPLGHRLIDGTLRPHDPAADSYVLSPALRPAGDVCMTPSDYGTFLADQLAGVTGGGRLGTQAMYRFLHAPDAPDEGDDIGYALGWGVRQTEVGPVSQHTGSADTFYAVVVLRTDADRGLALLANTALEVQQRAINSIARDFLKGSA